MTTDRLNLRPIFLLIGVLTMTFLARMLLSPLLLHVRAYYGFTHAEGGMLFFAMSVGFSLSMLLSGFVAERLNHRGTVLASAFIVGAALVLLGLGPPRPVFYGGLGLLGAGAGLYGPSGIAMLTDVAKSQHWGRALALHEIGPILGFFAAPLLATIAVRHATWQALFFLVAALSFGVAVLFLRCAEGGRFPGAPPSPRNIMQIWSVGRFWVIALFFVLAVGLEVGVYSMLPTFLVDERGLSEEVTNSLVGVSRLTALAVVFTAGWLADRFGAKRLIGVVAIGAGFATAGIGVARGPLLLAFVLFQPMVISAFFPAGLIELSRVAPAHSRNLAVALVIPVANLFGSGVFPAVLGYLAERGLFASGFVLAGLLMPAATLLLPLLPAKQHNGVKEVQAGRAVLGAHRLDRKGKSL